MWSALVELLSLDIDGVTSNTLELEDGLSVIDVNENGNV